MKWFLIIPVGIVCAGLVLIFVVWLTVQVLIGVFAAYRWLKARHERLHHKRQSLIDDACKASALCVK